MIQNLIIVESPNDAAFIKLILDSLTITNTETVPINPTEIDHLHNFVGTDGEEKRGKDALPEKIEMLKRELLTRYAQLQHISVIVDIDTPKSPNGGKDKSLQLINNSFERAFSVSPNLMEVATHATISTSISGENVTIDVFCFLIQDETGSGNLDILLKKIAIKYCVECDCLEVMNRCVVEKTDKTMLDFTKQWVNYYLRSNASKKQLKNAEKRPHEVITEQGKDIFDLNHSLLGELKSYLQAI